MPKYSKFMKDLLMQRGRGNKASKITLNERCSTVVLNEISLKEKDPEIFTIPCVIGQWGINKALADLGASISLIPYSMFVFPFDFMVLDMKEDRKIPIILGRPFLATAHAMIDVFNKIISFKVRDKTITLDIEKSMRFPPSDDDTCHSIDIIDLSILNHVQEILPSEPFDSLLFKPIDLNLPTKINKKELLLGVLAKNKGALAWKVIDIKELEELDEDAIRDSFLDEHLMVINIKDAETDPWTAYKAPIRSTLFRIVYGKACHLPLEMEHKAYWALKEVNVDLDATGKHRFQQLGGNSQDHLEA
ncbi:DNA-directed DNA polymerase [Tanacetum coccineum]